MFYPIVCGKLSETGETNWKNLNAYQKHYGISYEYGNYIYLAGMEMSMTCSVITEKVV